MIVAGRANEIAVDQEAKDNDRKTAAKHGQFEAAARADDRETNIAAEQIIGAISHIDDAHESERQREAAGEQKQQRTERDAVDGLEDCALHERMRKLQDMRRSGGA